MRVLWITNEPLSEALGLMSGQKAVSDSTGSWVHALSACLPSAFPGLELTVASPAAGVSRLTELSGKDIRHILLPVFGRNDVYEQRYEELWRQVRDMTDPDVVHIHGTEYPHGLAYVRACGAEHVLVSIQGVIHRVAEHYFGGIPVSEIAMSVTPRDIVRRDSLFGQKRRVERRSCLELEMLKSVSHVCGRTAWDREAVLAVNPGLVYHHSGELLREPFLSGRWSYESCVKGRLFVAQGHYPLKGLHRLMAAFPAVLASHPDVTVRVAGPAVVRGDAFSERIKISGYGLMLRRLMRRYGLKGRVEFIGSIDAAAMRQELLSCNAFVIPSAIENSPNSLGEAQMLGVPCVASRVGGIPDMIPDEGCGLMYDFDDREALAERVTQVLDLSAQFDGSHVRDVASERHSRETITSGLMDIYTSICR